MVGDSSKDAIFGLLTVLDPEFFEARAIVFSKMGQHKQALEIYVFKLEDYAKAEEYVIQPMGMFRIAG